MQSELINVHIILSQTMKLDAEKHNKPWRNCFIVNCALLMVHMLSNLKMSFYEQFEFV